MSAAYITEVYVTGFTSQTEPWKNNNNIWYSTSQYTSTILSLSLSLYRVLRLLQKGNKSFFPQILLGVCCKLLAPFNAIMNFTSRLRREKTHRALQKVTEGYRRVKKGGINKRGARWQMLIASGEGDQKRTRNPGAVKPLSLLLLSTRKIHSTASAGCANRGSRSGLCSFQNSLWLKEEHMSPPSTVTVSLQTTNP